MPVSRARQAGVNLVFKRQRSFSHYLSQFLRVLEAGDRFDGDCVRHHALFRTARFPGDGQKPAIGGLLRLRFGLRGDRFWPEGDFGRFVSGPRNPVSPMQIDLG